MQIEVWSGDLVAIRAWFLSEMYELMRIFRGSVTSWLRSEERNEKKGGSAESLHLLGLALDVEFDSPGEQARALDAAKARGIHFLDEGDHVHFQPLAPKSGIVAAVAAAAGIEPVPPAAAAVEAATILTEADVATLEPGDLKTEPCGPVHVLGGRIL